MIAEGVKGLLRTNKDNLVVWALRMEEASERRARGFGEVVVMVVVVAVVVVAGAGVVVIGFAAGRSLRALSQFSRRDLVEAEVFWRVKR